MSPSKRILMAAGVAVATTAASQLIPVTAAAEPEAEQELLHNIVYRARVDGVSRGATIAYSAQGDQTQTANPTMLPGRVFEANTVLPATEMAKVRVSVDWPYSANLHCEILVDDHLVAQADDFVAPRVTPQRDDPDYGALICQAPVTSHALPPGVSLDPVDPAEPVDLATPAAPPPA